MVAYCHCLITTFDLFSLLAEIGMCSEATQVLKPGHFLAWCGWCCTGCLSYAIRDLNNTNLDVVIMKQAWFDVSSATLQAYISVSFASQGVLFDHLAFVEAQD